MQFSGKATFHVSGAVNCRNVGIGGSENPHAYVEHQRDSPNVNAFCAVSSQKVYGPFFFAEETVTGITYLAERTDVHIPPRRKSCPLTL